MIDLDRLLDIASQQIPALSAAGPAVRRVQLHNPLSVWSLRREGTIVGCYAMLHLNAAGFDRLKAFDFDAANPDTALLARPGDTVAAIYKWAVVAPRLAAEGIRTVSRRLAAAPFARADLYARATTPPAALLMAHLGFRPIPGASAEWLLYVRKVNRTLLDDIAA